jgi:hypothetical protein
MSIKLIFILIFICFSSCYADGNEYYSQSLEQKAGDNTIVNDRILNIVKQKFNGRVISFTKRNSSNDSNCREFTKTILVGKEEHKATGTACLDKDGHFKTDNSYLVNIIMTDVQKVITIIIDVDSGEILEVRK